jgi:hypothetical protein
MEQFRVVPGELEDLTDQDLLEIYDQTLLTPIED